MVHIRTENGVWRTGGRGYTWAGKPDAWVLPFEEAVKRISHCGPEKHGAFILAEPDTPRRPEDDTIKALEADAALHKRAAEECL
ncbi:hypothetical protein Lokhon_01844 [Limimaricola hongkongensis DSM 17492]|uniref:Uncharacterized protein n=2 Tax=Limimaricola hongkongensis TaxID=278132 RepID=A0A017HD99_9RHOB|nr:hypothetical protein Lokhon_01844 [Limimaricola hongkongensis DSM 17492]